MCGICGVVRPAVDHALSETIGRMAHALHHRGPDGSGTWVDSTGTVGLGHARLAVIDPAGGRQPMSSADERYVMVYNGEMYNFHSLREELEQVGKRFRTQSDTEVLLEAYGYWGPPACRSSMACLPWRCMTGWRTSCFSRETEPESSPCTMPRSTGHSALHRRSKRSTS